MHHQRLPEPALPLERAIVRWTLLGSLGSSYVAYAAWAHGRALRVMCPSRLLLRRRCPLCGLTTATGHLVHGDGAAARRAHPLALPLWLGASAWYLWQTVTLANRIAQKVG